MSLMVYMKHRYISKTICIAITVIIFSFTSNAENTTAQTVITKSSPNVLLISIDGLKTTIYYKFGKNMD